MAARPRISVKSAARAALAADARARALPGGPVVSAVSADSFANLNLRLGMLADGPLSGSTYRFNPITRQRTLLEFMYRGSWLAGKAIDVPADDMTRAGVQFTSELPPNDLQRIQASVDGHQLWPTIADVIRWGRLYGGAIGVVLVDGQDPRTPLRPNTVGPGQFQGLLCLDRWMLEPELSDLVTDFGPFLGQPKYYRVSSNAPALRGQSLHYTRVAFRILGITLPYQQALTENLWGESVLERLHDRMVGFDAATLGASQLVHKSFLRTLKVDGLRDLVAAGGKPFEGFVQYVETMRRFQSNEGVTILDGKDDFDAVTQQAMSGMSDVILQLGQQLAGALDTPLVRLFGQSPAGLNSSGESDLRTYYDFLAQQQVRNLLRGVTLCYILTANSLGIQLPRDFGLKFASLWQMTDTDKAAVASTVTTAVSTALEAGLISEQTGMQELRQISRTTGVFTNIPQEAIDAADTHTGEPPSAQDLLQGLSQQFGVPGATPDPLAPDSTPTPPPGVKQDEQVGPDGQEATIPRRPRQRIVV